jgi:hypothetical protein
LGSATVRGNDPLGPPLSRGGNYRSFGHSPGRKARGSLGQIGRLAVPAVARPRAAGCEPGVGELIINIYIF